MIGWHLLFVGRNLRKARGRALLGVLAIAFSVAMLVAVNGLVDDISNSYTATVMNDLSEADVVVRHKEDQFISNASSLNPSFDGAQVKGVTYRLEIDGGVFFTGKKNVQRSFPIKVLGLNTTQEDILGLGGFEPQVGSIGLNQCLLVGNFGSQVQSTVGEDFVVRLYLPGGEVVNQSLTVAQQVTQYRRIPTEDWNVVVVSLETLQQHLGFDTASTILAMFEDHDSVYSISHIEGTLDKVTERGSTIQHNLGLDYVVELPLAKAIEGSKESLDSQRIFMNFISIVVLLIASVLIYSLTSTSVEEKIRDYGIFRAVGVKDRSVIFQSALQAGLVGFVGVVFGLVVGYILTTPGLSFLTDGQVNIPFNTSTYIYALLLGLLVTFVASLNPVLHATRKQILVALDVSRADSAEFQSRVSSYRSSWVQWNKFFWGVGLAFVGFFVFVVMPAVRFFLGEEEVNTLALGLIFFVLVGLILIVLGLFGPLLESFFLKIIALVSTKAAFGARLFLRKNRRRNSFTMLIFALVLSFVFFMNTLQTVNIQTNLSQLQTGVGSDLLVFSGGTEGEWLGEEMYNFTQEYDGIRSAFLTIPTIFTITGCEVRVGDDIFFRSFSPLVYGSSSNLLGAVFDDVELYSDSDYSRLDENGTIAIPGSLAKVLDVGVGDNVRVQVGSSIEASQKLYGKDLYLEIVAVLVRLPGISQVSDIAEDAGRAPIFVGKPTWETLVQPVAPTPNQDPVTMDDYIQRIFVRDTGGVLEDFKTDFFLRYGADVQTIDYAEVYEVYQRSLSAALTGLTIILSLSIVIAFFAVFSSTSTTVAEARKDIGVLKAIGLRDREISNIFIMESVVLCLASSFLGSIAGYLTAYFPSFNNALWNNTPLPLVMPPPAIIFTFVLAVLFAIIGAYIPARGITRMETTEILR